MRIDASTLCWLAGCMLMVPMAMPKAVQPPGHHAGIEDACNTTVAVPAQVRSALILTPTMAEYLFVTRRPDAIVSGYAANKMIVENGLLKNIYPQLDSSRVGSTDIPGQASAETIFTMAPDVVFDWAFRGPFFKSLGLPVACIALRRDEESSVLLNARIYAEAMHQPGRGTGLAAGYRTEFDRLRRQLQSLPTPASEETAPRILFASVESTGRVHALTSPTRSALIGMAGGHDVREDLPEDAMIDTEEMLRLDPDIIVLQPRGLDGGGMTPQDFMQSPLWQSLKSVRDRRVYLIPRGAAISFYGIVETPLFARWVAEILQPALPREFRQKMRAAYQRELGYRLSEQELDWILAMPENRSSTGYQRFSAPPGEGVSGADVLTHSARKN